MAYLSYDIKGKLSRRASRWSALSRALQPPKVIGAHFPPSGVGMVEIFGDESGGSDSANETFVVATVAVAPREATRLIKSFRKVTGIVGEIKGHRLSLKQRVLFFDLFAKEADALATAVACRRVEPTGGWAMSALPEIILYEHLFAEALTSLAALKVARHLTVTLDRGRYKKIQLNSVRSQLLATIASRFDAHTSIDFGDSASSGGLQIADVIANSVFQLDRSSETAKLLQPLVGAGRVRIQTARLEAVRPGWLVAV